MEDESALSVAISWTILGMVFGVYFLVKLGAFKPLPTETELREPRVLFEEADTNRSE